MAILIYFVIPFKGKETNFYIGNNPSVIFGFINKGLAWLYLAIGFLEGERRGKTSKKERDK